ncbi:MAG: NAD-dependent epimerase/dehydratase family protein [Flammeovirgaceae bacterium]
MNNKILVTGAAGFIGFHLSKRLIEQGYHVIGLDNLNTYYDIQLKLDRLKNLGIQLEETTLGQHIQSTSCNFELLVNNLENDEVWNVPAMESVTEVINLAAQAGVRYSLENPKSYVSSNVNGFLNILEFCRTKSIKHLLYASSSSVYGMESTQPFSESERCDKPVSLYAATKRANELMAYTYNHLYNINVMGLRFFTVYGPWGRPDMAPMLFAKAAFANEPIKVFNHGNQSRDFTYIDDIINGIVELFENRQNLIKGAEVCNIGNGSPVPLMEFIGAMENATGKTIEKHMIDAQPGDVKVTFANTEKLKNLTGYQAQTAIHDGVDKFMTWYKSYHEINA